MWAVQLRNVMWRRLITSTNIFDLHVLQQGWVIRGRQKFQTDLIPRSDTDRKLPVAFLLYLPLFPK
jgi:hypothetical protein